MVVTEQEFQEWQEHLVTKAFRKAMLNDRDLLKEYLLVGSDNDERLRGKAEAITAILRMEYADLMESVRENKHE